MTSETHRLSNQESSRLNRSGQYRHALMVSAGIPRFCFAITERVSIASRDNRYNHDNGQDRDKNANSDDDHSYSHQPHR